MRGVLRRKANKPIADESHVRVPPGCSFSMWSYYVIPLFRALLKKKGVERASSSVGSKVSVVDIATHRCMFSWSFSPWSSLCNSVMPLSLASS